MTVNKPISVLLGCWLATVVSSVAATCNTELKSNVEPARYQTASAAAVTVTDTVTGLIWQRCPAGYHWEGATCSEVPETQKSFTWQQALQYAQAVGQGWRLPNVKELESLVKRNCWSPAIESDVFSSVELGYMWTSTGVAAYYGNAWAVYFLDGGVVSQAKDIQYKVRLVKSP